MLPPSLYTMMVHFFPPSHPSHSHPSLTPAVKPSPHIRTPKSTTVVSSSTLFHQPLCQPLKILTIYVEEEEAAAAAAAAAAKAKTAAEAAAAAKATRASADASSSRQTQVSSVFFLRWRGYHVFRRLPLRRLPLRRLPLRRLPLRRLPLRRPLPRQRSPLRPRCRPPLSLPPQLPPPPAYLFVRSIQSLS